MIRGLFANWRFRSSRPGFAAGDEIRAYLTGFDPATGQGTARIGDTVLQVTGAAPGQVDQLIDLRVESFDAARATGQAVLRG
ncbi:hypothetical protein [Thioalkalivibrio sp. XN279]|uniref:DUF7513 family protein n=1 Tax=Thioalkalivibrio sp. XN279 TaxID=2714953 RepID=UPI00140D1A26|nr:hypothetical protein [Thioalkalivibrio sp. XN279]NHA15197.1 hypothetical protein [Thioalkalivibrio sp. XN279]